MMQIQLKQGREKSIARRHPWIFSGAIAHAAEGAGVGDTVDVVSAAGDFLARAAYSPASQIRLRVWTFAEAETVDAAFVRARLTRAIETRRRLGLLEPEGACRLVFAEADGLPGVIVDRYADFVSCQLLAAGAERWRETIGAAVLELTGCAGVYERSEASARRKEGLPSRRGVLAGEAPPPLVEVRLAGVRQLVDVASGQKTGAYLDQQANRLRVAAYVRGGSVLDAFAYGGGFAIACLRAGCAEAELLDSSAEALAAARRNAELNGVEPACTFKECDVFDELRALRAAGRRFDVVVLDPPKFVHSAEQVRAGSRGYKDINLLALGLVRPGGVLATFSCSGHVDAGLFQKIVAGAAVDARREARILERLGHPPDHPIALEFPEGDYLKGLILQVD